MPEKYKRAVSKIKARLRGKGASEEEAESSAHAIATSKNVGNVKATRRSEKKHHRPGRDRASKRKRGNR